MPKLRNVSTGVVVVVSDTTATRLGSDWVPFDGTEPLSDVPDKSWKVAALKAYAEEHEIDLGAATKKDDILAVIAAADVTDEPEGDEPVSDENDDESDEGDES